MFLQVFSVAEEEALVGFLKKCSAHYYGLSADELRVLAYQFAKTIRSNYPPNWDVNRRSGLDWYHGFMRRHRGLNAEHA